MLDFNEMVDNYVHKEFREKTVGRYYPSECGYCLRKIWYSYKQPKETDLNVIKIFEMGNMVHDFVVDVLKSEKNPHIELVGVEVPFQIKIDGVIISGRIDDIIEVKLDGKKYLVEVKSTSSLKYTEKAQEAHVMQLQLYMYHTHINHGIVLYVEKNTLQCKPFFIDYDQEKAEAALGRFFALHKCLKENKIPEPEARIISEKNWQCKSCPYREECEKTT